MSIEMVEEEAFNSGTMIKVIGVGGGGGNAVEHMINTHVQGVEFICANTDAQALRRSAAHKVIQLGQSGLGAGSRPERGRDAAMAAEEDIRAALEGAHMLFITAGMGGGTGTGATPFVSHLAKEMGALVVGVVTTPFNFEGAHRRGDAISGVRRIRPYMDNLIVIHNDRLLRYVNHDAEMLEAFRTADEVVTQGILSVSELINVPGEINVDFADVRTIMDYPGGALMAIGSGNGKMGPVEAARQAISNPLLNMSIADAKGILFSVKGGHDVTLGGCNAAGQLIRKQVDSKAPIFFGMTVDYSMEQSVQITLIATGLKEETWFRSMTDIGGITDSVRKMIPIPGIHIGKDKSLAFTPAALKR